MLVLGSGGLSIGQAGEFDYSGSQAVKAMKVRDNRCSSVAEKFPKIYYTIYSPLSNFVKNLIFQPMTYLLTWRGWDLLLILPPGGVRDGFLLGSCHVE